MSNIRVIWSIQNTFMFVLALIFPTCTLSLKIEIKVLREYGLLFLGTGGWPTLRVQES